jgi:hypothetical protein
MWSERADSQIVGESQVGDLLPRRVVKHGRARRIEATAFVIPGAGELRAYLEAINKHRDDFAAWDGRVVVLGPHGRPQHRVVIVDRYGQVYDVTSTGHADSLPTAASLEEWFKFLATACPECGVIDDPRPREWTP